MNLGKLSMSESIQLADKDPNRAIEGFRQSITADPYNAGAHDWLAALLFEQKRYPEFIREIREARRMGLLGQMSRNPRFRAAFSQARFNRSLAADIGE